MDNGRFWFTLLTVCLLGGTGCKKREQYVGPPQEYYGIKVNWAKLNTEFTNASPDVQANVSLAVRAFRYALFTNALVELDKLANNPNGIPVRVITTGGDSMVMEAGPFPSVLRPGQTVTTLRTVEHMKGNKLTGTVEAHYSSGDVFHGKMEGTCRK